MTSDDDVEALKDLVQEMLGILAKSHKSELEAIKDRAKAVPIFATNAKQPGTKARIIVAMLEKALSDEQGS